MSKFFSKSSINDIDPLIQAKVARLCDKLEEHAGSHDAVNVSMAFSCMTTDIVTDYAFSRSYDFLKSPMFEPNFHESIAAATQMGPTVKHFPLLMNVMLKMPEYVLRPCTPLAPY